MGWSLVKCLALIALLCFQGCQKHSGGDSIPPDTEEPDEPIDPTPNPVQNPNLPSYSFNFDKETPGGIKIESNNNNMPSLSDIDDWYLEVRQCIADWYDALYPDEIFEFVSPPPVILWNNDISAFCEQNTGEQGVYCPNYFVPFVVLETGWAQFEFMWKHEFTHHILYKNGMSNKQNLNHLPDQIWDCQLQ